MVLVDTSVWVCHLRESDSNLERLLHGGQVMCHPYIVGELTCGNMKNRREILSLIQDLPQATLAQLEEIFGFIESNHLMGKGLGYIDVHLSAAALLTGVPLWSYDKRLNETNEMPGISFDPVMFR
ncbi:type II toxin-antitoxin system VapC family toxin [Desulfomonile tiedjei]|uniref:Putative nucleic acid-binding protein, contains PIN domain n=1 Tax=Desulfomonile tiedjei (strain ATCC 49306 / DSM 6799 / DCB-1) TaxID=706587 RepID=I4C1B6_DESTA|nr:PIN domain nuclease [Desulfomonile tiedjei]AFM23357.1 putative nucleic acid-binding protein, contains PIN domain [Desulfomonile tiedjei DSM 6799]